MNKILFILGRYKHDNDIIFISIDLPMSVTTTSSSITFKIISKKSSLSICILENRLNHYEYDSNLLNNSKKTSGKSSLNVSSPNKKKSISLDLILGGDI